MKTSGATGHKTHVASRTRQDALQPGSEKESTFKRRSISELVDPSKQKAFYVGLVEPPYERFIAHLQCRVDNNAKHASVQQLKQKHIIPVMVMLHCSKMTVASQHKIEASSIDVLRRYAHPLTHQRLVIGYTLDEYEQSIIQAGEIAILHFLCAKAFGLSEANGTEMANCQEKDAKAMGGIGSKAFGRRSKSRGPSLSSRISPG